MHVQVAPINVVDFCPLDKGCSSRRVLKKVPIFPSVNLPRRPSWWASGSKVEVLVGSVAAEAADRRKKIRCGTRLELGDPAQSVTQLPLT